MNTPITDKFSDYPQDFLTSDKVIHADVARRLELDRAALMEALENMVAMVGTDNQPISEAIEALAAARANFPTE